MAPLLSASHSSQHYRRCGQLSVVGKEQGFDIADVARKCSLRSLAARVAAKREAIHDSGEPALRPCSQPPTDFSRSKLSLTTASTRLYEPRLPILDVLRQEDITMIPNDLDSLTTEAKQPS